MATSSNPHGFPSFTKTWHSSPYDSISPLVRRSALSTAGRSVLVTGGGTGIGAAIARAFAAAGSTNIALVSRNAKALDRTAAAITAEFPNAKVLAVGGVDLVDPAATDAAFQRVVAEFGGPVDVLVSNSGYMNTPGPLQHTDLPDWWRGFEVNVLGAANAARSWLNYAAPGVAGQPENGGRATGGAILNISSGIAHMPAMASGVSAYAASKAAGVKLFEYIAVENPAVHVVHVQPGVVDSDLNRKSTVPGVDHRECSLHTSPAPPPSIPLPEAEGRVS